MANAKYGNCVDYSGIAGNDAAKRALQIAAAGGHGILLIGPSGSEKEALDASCPPFCRNSTRERRGKPRSSTSKQARTSPKERRERGRSARSTRQRPSPNW